MSLSLPQENQERELVSNDRLLSTVCAEPECDSQRDLQLVLDASPVPTARMLCRTCRKNFWGVSS
jgi:hypothetical protein